MQNRYDSFKCVCNNNIIAEKLFTVFTYLKYDASIRVNYLIRVFINVFLFLFSSLSLSLLSLSVVTESLFNFFFSKFTHLMVILTMIIHCFRMNLRIFSSFSFFLISSIFEYVMVVHFE